jgi:hypothetical protein
MLLIPRMSKPGRIFWRPDDDEVDSPMTALSERQLSPSNSNSSPAGYALPNQLPPLTFTRNSSRAFIGAMSSKASERDDSILDLIVSL